MAHGDLKPENLVLSDDNRLVAIDFGHTEKVTARINHLVGTPGYQAQEMLKGSSYDIERADIYALSVSLFIILFQDVPFGKVLFEDVMKLYNCQGIKKQFFDIHYDGKFREDQRHS